MSGYIGTVPVPQATQTREAFTATANQTSFATIGYEPGFLDVFLNGVKLAAADYTATNATNVVLATGAAVNDILEIVAYKTFNVTNTLAPNGSAANLTNLPAAQLTGALPAISGAALTGLVATFSGLSDTTVATSNPAANTNPTSGLGHIWVNKTSGQMYVCTNATAGSNVWSNIGVVAAGLVAATGGTVTTDGDYKVHTFTSNGTFNITAAGSVDYLFVGGGGGGGAATGTYDGCGGGGAGGFRPSQFTVASPVACTVTIGAGGGSANNGGATGLQTPTGLLITTLGGGAGSKQGAQGGFGGSGGGTGGNNGQGGTAEVFMGNKGGGQTSNGSSGGGGAGAVGQDQPLADTGGAGGNGLANSITGASVTYAGGGGGGGYHDRRANGRGLGGSGGGGAGGNLGAVQGVNATGIGSGGGGAFGNNSGGTGSAGIAIFRYKFQ